MPKIAYEQRRFTEASTRVIEQADSIISEYQEQGYNLTLRQLYYQFVARGLIPNTEQSYNRLGNIISDARRAGLIDWTAIEDRTRFMRDLPSWDTPQDIMKSTEQSYHRDLWANQDIRVEVWIEKDALVGVIENACNEFDVPFLSCRGYVSDSEIWRQAMRLLSHKNNGQGTLILHLGDHDPSGLDMTRDIKERLRTFTQAPAYINVKHIALTIAQIEELKPPTNPAKFTDSRYKSYVLEYGTESWELDALEPKYIDGLLRQEISTIGDTDRWNEIYDQQEVERKQIGNVATRWGKLLATGIISNVTDNVTDNGRCLVCDSILKHKRRNSQYCSNRCRQKAYRLRSS